MFGVEPTHKIVEPLFKRIPLPPDLNSTDGSKNDLSCVNQVRRAALEKGETRERDERDKLEQNQGKHNFRSSEPGLKANAQNRTRPKPVLA